MNYNPFEKLEKMAALEKTGAFLAEAADLLAEAECYTEEKMPQKQSKFDKWPDEARPRERLFKTGPRSLSDRELIALILGSGTRKKNVMKLAGEVLELLNSSNSANSENGIPEARRLEKLKGLGKSKASAIVAMLEFGRRLWAPKGRRVSCPHDFFDLLRHYADSPQEHFFAVTLNGGHEVIATRVITTGLANRSLIHPREIYADAIGDRAVAVCIAHNHPAGTLEPSEEDDNVTFRLRDAAELLGLTFLDHIVFTKSAYYSYRKMLRI